MKMVCPSQPSAPEPAATCDGPLAMEHALACVRVSPDDFDLGAEVDALREPGLAARFGVLTVPSTVVIGSGGAIRAVNSGAAAAERLAVQAGLDGSRWESARDPGRGT